MTQKTLCAACFVTIGGLAASCSSPLRAALDGTPTAPPRDGDVIQADGAPATAADLPARPLDLARHTDLGTHDAQSPSPDSRSLPVSGFSVGFARQPITPTVPDTWTDVDHNLKWEPAKDTFVDGNGNGTFDPVWLAGFGNGRAARGVHDDLYAIAAVIDDGKTRVAIVALDAIGWLADDYADIKNAIPKQLFVSQLYVHATHNHITPDTVGMWGPSYIVSGIDKAHMDYVKAQAVKAITEAAAKLQPARMYLGQVIDPKHEGPDGLGVIDSRPHPYVLDYGIRWMLFKEQSSGKVIGTIVNWANHVETSWSDNLFITSDYPHYLREALDDGMYYGGQDALKAGGKQVRPGLGGISMFVAGNVGGLATTWTEIKVHDDYLNEDFYAKTDNDLVPWEKVRAQGYGVAKVVLDAIAAGNVTESITPKIATYTKAIDLKATNATLIAAVQLGIIKHKSWWWGSFYTPTEVNVLTIGDAWVTLVPGELYPEIATGEVKSYAEADFPGTPYESPGLRSMMKGKVNFFFNLTNDFMGYIIPRTEWDKHAPWLENDPDQPYGEDNSVGPDTAPAIYDAAKELLLQAGNAP